MGEQDPWGNSNKKICQYCLIFASLRREGVWDELIFLPANFSEGPVEWNSEENELPVTVKYECPGYLCAAGDFLFCEPLNLSIKRRQNQRGRCSIVMCVGWNLVSNWYEKKKKCAQILKLVLCFCSLYCMESKQRISYSFNSPNELNETLTVADVFCHCLSWFSFMICYWCYSS